MIVRPRREKRKCPGGVQLHVLEERSLLGTGFSAVPDRYVPQQLHVRHFDDQASFESGLREAFTRMHALSLNVSPGAPAPTRDPQHILVISAHGKMGTGTELTTLKDRINAHLVDQRLFKLAPRNLVVLLSACWGAYPGFVETFRRGPAQPPTIIGAIVNVHPRHANELQKRIVSSLCCSGHNEASLALIVREANKRLRPRYDGAAPFRITLGSGRRYPKRAGLAVPLLKTRKFLVVALQSGLTLAGAHRVVLLGADGRYWLAPRQVFPETTTLGECYETIGKAAWIDRLSGIGALCELSRPRLCARPPAFFRAYRAPFPHSDGGSTNAAPSSRSMPLAVMSQCKRCSWASLGNRQTKRDDITTHHWTLRCTFAGSCPLHPGQG